MSIFENIFAGDKSEDKLENVENVGEMIKDVAGDIIRKLSGADIVRTKKVVDNLVVISNASGGTGASTITSNVAYIASKKGLDVLVIDLNVMNPIQHIFLGIKQKIEKTDLVGYLTGKNSLGESIEMSGNIGIMYSNNRNLSDDINIESDVATSNLTLALERLRGLFDLILIDCPMRIEHTLMNTAFYESDRIYIVWDEGIASIANTEKIRRNMAFSGIDAYQKMSVVLNKRTNIHYTKYPFKKLGIKLEQVLPFDVNIIESSLKSEIFCDKGASKSDNTREFYNGIVSLTDKILENGGYITDGSA